MHRTLSRDSSGEHRPHCSIIAIGRQQNKHNLCRTLFHILHTYACCLMSAAAPRHLEAAGRVYVNVFVCRSRVCVCKTQQQPLLRQPLDEFAFTSMCR